MFHFAGLSSITYGFSHGYTGMTLYGLPHSDISGSSPVCGSPKLFAAYRVLHRLLAPRHPPYALYNLTIPGSPSPLPLGSVWLRRSDASLHAYTTGITSRLLCARSRHLRGRSPALPFVSLPLCALLSFPYAVFKDHLARFPRAFFSGAPVGSAYACLSGANIS